MTSTLSAILQGDSLRLVPLTPLVDLCNPIFVNMNDFGGYTLTDAYLRYQTALGGLTFSVSNLFDKHYIDYSSDTRLPTDNLSYFAGRGRAFTLGWDYRF